MSRSPPAFDARFRDQLNALFAWRRDVRSFRDEPLAEGTLERLVETACLAPSVGLSEPWRFVCVESPAARAAIIDNFTRCNREALEACAPDRAALYARLKLAGLREAPAHLAVFADHATAQGAGLGRRTMPEMLDYSVVSAICCLWLAARADGIGMGWVSILDPDEVRRVLQVPPAWRLIGYFCLGHPAREDDEPELQAAGWERRRPANATLSRA